MAGGKERTLRRRIRSVQSTKKITRAMELIAATRVVKAQQRVFASRPYAENITAVIQNLSAAGGGVDHPLLRPLETDTPKVAFVVIAGDRGLAGPYNTNVIRAAERELQARRTEGSDYSLVLVGKKADTYFRFRGYNIDAFFADMTDQPTYEDARQVAGKVRSMFESGQVDEVVLVYTNFITVGTQRPTVREFLPLKGVTPAEGSDEAAAGYEFEPAPDEILVELLPRYVEARIYAALLDAAASEHASRQRAMKSATDNAEELIIKLSREMNRARQDAITTEIMEIVGGAEALRSGSGDEMDLIPDYALSVGDLLVDTVDYRS